MSSGSGKKKLVASAVSPLSFSIAAIPAASQTPTGGIKLLIDKNRIVSVPSTRSQPIVVHRQSQAADHQNASVSQPPANEDNLRIACSTAGDNATVSYKAVPGAQKLVFKKITPVITGPEAHGVSGEMRVKVTGDDLNRNGQPMASGGGQLKQIKIVNNLMGRRMSIHQQLPSIPTAQESDSNNAPQTVTLYTTTARLADEKSLLKHKITSNMAVNSPQPVPTVSATATLSLVPVTTSADNRAPVSSSAQSRPASIVVDVSSTSNAQNDQSQGTVSSNDDSKNGKDGSTAISARQSPPIKSLKHATENVATPVTATQTAQERTTDAVAQPATTMETGENGKYQPQQPTAELVTNDGTGIDGPSTSINDTVMLGEEVVSKPSREMKLLQVTQAKSKVLSEFITDTISKGKLRKRRSDSIVDAGMVGTVDTGVSSTRVQLGAPPRKRNRKGSTITDAFPDNGKELATDDSHKLENFVNESPATRVRIIRSAKSERWERNAASLSGGAKNFFSNLNLQHESNESNDQLFPGDPPKPGWDRFCWRCKQSGPELGCSSCIRSYHKYCVRYPTEDPNWSCTECKMINNRTIDIEAFITNLGYAVKMLSKKIEWKHLNPINKSRMPDYDKYITRHMDLAVLNELYAQKAYKSPEEFMNDIGWIVHNMSIYPDNIDLLKKARSLHKRAKREMDEMDPCYECYTKDNTLSSEVKDWFREPCSKPHLLVWAKMKGYPYWPGKLMVINANNQAFVRFFGTHDRSWMSVKECYLYSLRDPNPPKHNLKSKMLVYATSVEDITHHIARLREQFNTFNYGSFKEAVDPSRLEEHQRAMFPGAFLKKVKVTIKRSEGEMVAVASAASDEAADKPLKTKISVVETEKDPKSVSKAPATNVTTSSPRKRMTRRMSRFMKSAEESTGPITNTVSSQDLAAPSSASLLLNDDKAEKNNQTSDAMVESNVAIADDMDCNPKNLSLLLRRGSQSWETEPLSKRQKSSVEKCTVVSAASKTTKATTDSQAKETQVKEAVVEPVAEKVIVPPNALIEQSILVSVAPTDTKSTVTDFKAKEALQKQVLEPVAAKTIILPNAMNKKTVVASVASTKTKATASKGDEKKLKAIVVDAVEPVTGKVTLASSTALIEKNPPPAALNQIAGTAAGTHNDPQRLSKQGTTGAQLSHTHAHTTAANSSVVVSIPEVTVMTTATTTTTRTTTATTTATTTTTATITPTKPWVDPLKSGANINTPPVCTTSAASISETASNVPNATSTVKAIPASITVIDIKKEIVSDDEVNVVECPKDELPVPTKVPAGNDSSALSASSDVTNSQHIALSVSSASVLKPVHQTPPAVLPVTSSAITSNQRARKSFPGGASNTKHVSSKQATSLVHTVSLPATITVPSASPSPQQIKTNPQQQSFITPMNATVSIPKELVTPSTEVTVIPCTDTHTSVNNDVSNDNDDVLIIEEETIPILAPSKGRKMDGKNQLPPPLVPRPPETSHCLPSDDDSMMELNRTMQLFDDSSNRVLDHIRTVMEDLLKDMAGNGSSLAELVTLKLNQERQQELWQREKEKQQNAFDSRLEELRISLEQDKQRALIEQRQQLQREKQRAVQSTKMKQWCKKCFSEAHYYCCWNTSYCSAACQKKHWMEHQNDCTQDHANNARSVQSGLTVTNSVVSSDGNNSGSAGTTISPHMHSPHMHSRSYLQMSAVPSAGGGDASNLLNKRSPSNRVLPSEITSTSTPLHTPVRLIPSSLSANVSYKTPIIQSVQGRDGVILNLPPHSPQNGGNATLGVTSSVTTSTPQQLMQKRAAARDKSNQLAHQKVDSRNKAYTLRKAFEITSPPYQGTNNLLTSVTSTIVPSAASTYATVSLADAVTVSGVSPSVWNQMAMLQSTGSRQLHSGTSFVTAGGASVAPADGTGKGYLPVELGFRQSHSTVTSLAQQQKIVPQQPSSGYKRHQQ